MTSNELDKLMTDDFLDSLESEENHNRQGQTEQSFPSWVPDNEAHTAYKAWRAILELTSKKEIAIKEYKKIANNKTPKSLYEIKKTEIGRIVCKAQQNLFYGKAPFCKGLNEFFEEQNKLLRLLFVKEQERLISRQKVTGVRAKKKMLIVNEYQKLRDTVNFLRRKNAMETIDLAIERMPADLQAKFTKSDTVRSCKGTVLNRKFKSI